jgi:hypothetical protein
VILFDAERFSVTIAARPFAMEERKSSQPVQTTRGSAWSPGLIVDSCLRLVIRRSIYLEFVLYDKGIPPSGRRRAQN